MIMAVVRITSLTEFRHQMRSGDLPACLYLNASNKMVITFLGGEIEEKEDYVQWWQDLWRSKMYVENGGGGVEAKMVSLRD